MKNIFVKLSPLAAIILLLGSCKQEVLPEVKKISVEDLIMKNQLNPAIQNATSIVSFYSSGSFNSEVKNYAVNGSVGKGSNIKTLSVDGITIDSYDGDGNFAFLDDERKLAAISGKEVNIEFKSGASQPSARTNSNVQMGRDLRVGGTPVQGGNDPRRYQLTWTPSGLNQKVYILIRFNKGSGFNKKFWNYADVERYIETSDSGGYLLTGNDFVSIPYKGFTNVLVVRGNVALLGGTSTQAGGTVITSISTAELTGNF